MKIGIIFDLKDDYSIENTSFCDFTCLEEVMILADILTEMGHKVKLLQSIDLLLKNFEYTKSTFDIVINLTEGHKSRNREALIPALLETYNIPYIGSDCYANIVTLDKYLTKLIARDIGVQTPDFALYLWRKKIVSGEIPSGQVVLKPVCEGSSAGIELVDTKTQNINEHLKKMGLEFKENILLENYIKGGDYSVALIGTPSTGYTVIGAVKILDRNSNNLPIYDKEDKEDLDIIKTTPDWSDDLKEEIFESCIRLAETIEMSGFFRVDFRVDNEKYYFLEINSIPSLVKSGSFIKAIDLAGIDRKQIFERILKNENT